MAQRKGTIQQKFDADVDEATRTVVLSFASEIEVKRWYGIEVLNVTEETFNLSRLRDSGALLLNHKIDQHIGVVEEAWIKDRRAYAKVRFSKSALGEEVFRDVQDKIRKNSSFMYVYDDIKWIGERDGEDIYRVEALEAVEVSIVSIPADTSVGVGRSLGGGSSQGDDGNQDESSTKFIFDEINETYKRDYEMVVKGASVINSAETNPALVSTGSQASAREAEIKEILEICKAHNQMEMGFSAVAEGRSIGDVRDLILKRIASTHVQNPVSSKVEGALGLEERDLKRFSWRSAIASLVVQGYDDAGFERELSQETKMKYGARSKEGLCIPPEIFLREMSTRLEPMNAWGTDKTQGGNFVGTDMKGDMLIRSFYDRLVIKQLGARVLTDLNGNIQIPKQTSSAKAEWLPEGATPQGSTATTGQVGMAPKRVATFVDYTRQLILQSSPDVENMVEDDLKKAVALAFDYIALFGAGTANEPLGLMNIKDLQTVPMTGPMTLDDIIELETIVSEANAYGDRMGYLTNASMRGYLKTLTEGPNSSDKIWKMGANGDGFINGTRAIVSQIIPRTRTLSPIIYGDWSQLMIGEWGPVFLKANTYIGQSAGIVRIDVEQNADIARRHDESFAVIKGADTTLFPEWHTKWIGEGGTPAPRRGRNTPTT